MSISWQKNKKTLAAKLWSNPICLLTNFMWWRLITTAISTINYSIPALCTSQIQPRSAPPPCNPRAFDLTLPPYRREFDGPVGQLITLQQIAQRLFPKYVYTALAFRSFLFYARFFDSVKIASEALFTWTRDSVMSRGKQLSRDKNCLGSLIKE
jgi:hypothetical protein